jgi:hypothetical protein
MDARLLEFDTVDFDRLPIAAVMTFPPTMLKSMRSGAPMNRRTLRAVCPTLDA